MGTPAAVEVSNKGGKARRARVLRARLTKPGLGQLAAVAAAALRFWPPLYAQSILGLARSWLRPHRELSEFTIIDLRRAIRSLRFLTAVGVPAIGRRPPAPVEALLPSLLERLFWRTTTVFEQPHPAGGGTAHSAEKWFFINGVATNGDVARMNAELLARMFHRPVTVIQNATHSLGIDLGECALGKEFLTAPKLDRPGSFTEPALEATIEVLGALNDPGVEKVVLIAHSQGTIIAANVLRAAYWSLAATATSTAGGGRRAALARASKRVAAELTAGLDGRDRGLQKRLGATLSVFGDRRAKAVARLEKLEVYTFANCADKMRWLVRRGDRVYPWIENFANQHDLVARLGVLSPYRDQADPIAIDGPVYKKTAGGGWGHLLNEHHLFDILDHLERPDEVENPYPAEEPGAPPVPRLYGYFGGGSPAE